MACGHCFHEVCILAFAESRSLTLHTVPCPVCKRSRRELADEADHLLAGHMPGNSGSSGSGGPVPEIDLLGDATPPAGQPEVISPGDDEPPDDDEPTKGQGKAKGKGRGKGKGKGKAKGNGKGGKGNDEGVEVEEGDESAGFDETDDGFDDTTDDGLGDHGAPKAKAKAKSRAKATGKAKARATGKGKGKGPVAAVDAAVVAGAAVDAAVVAGPMGGAAKAKAKPKAKAAGKATARATGKGKGKGPDAAGDAAVVDDDPDVPAAPLPSPGAMPQAKATGKGQAKATGKGKGKGKGPVAAVVDGDDDPLAAFGAIFDDVPAASLPSPGAMPIVPVVAVASDPHPHPHPHPHFSTDVLCDSCGRHEHFKRCRLIAKKAGRWQCSGCGCRAVMLRRKFGQWPTDAFLNLSPDCFERNPEESQESKRVGNATHSGGHYKTPPLTQIPTAIASNRCDTSRYLSQRWCFVMASTLCRLIDIRCRSIVLEFIQCTRRNSNSSGSRSRA
jgi:hypothetical protein